MGFPRYLSAQEIADFALDGLPQTPRGVFKRAKSTGWQFQDLPRKQGGRQYAVASLPEQARADLEARYANENPPAPRRPVGRPEGSGAWFVTHPEQAEAVKAFLFETQVSSAVVRERLAALFEELPSPRTLRRFIADIKREHALVLERRHDPSGYKSKRRISLGRADARITYANQRWEIDTTPADVHLREGRMAILGVIDVFSRRVRFLVAKSESAQSVRRLLSETMQAWGAMPSEIATDQGSGYINKAIVSAIELLGIEHHACPPASPEKKPYIERVFGTFQRARAEILAGYCGHNVAEAQRLRERARKETGKPLIVPELTAAGLQDILDNWADGPYLQSRHSTLGMTPLAKWQSSPRGGIKSPSADELRLVLSAFVGTRTVGKRGVEWKRGRYWAPALAPYVGRPVQVRRDEDELGELMIFDERGRFIDIAVNHERSGLSEEEFAKAARRDMAKHEREANAIFREHARKYTMESARSDILRADAELAGKLVTLPGRVDDRMPETVRSIREAPEPHSATEPARSKTKPAAPVAPGPMADWTGEQKVAEADAIKAAQARGEDVDQARIDWADNYIERGGYQAVKFARMDPSRRTGNPYEHGIGSRRMRR